MLGTDPKKYRIHFRERYTESDIAARRLHSVITGIDQRRTRGPQEQLITATDPIIGEIRIGLRYRNSTIQLAGIDINPKCIAAAEGIRLLDRARNRQFFTAGKAGAQHDVSRGFLNH